MPRLYKGTEANLKLLVPICGVNPDDGLEEITITENGEYEGRFDKVIVNIEDTNGSYEEGYNEGVQEQKSKLSSISITENGEYSNEDGYNQIEVNVDVGVKKFDMPYFLAPNNYNLDNTKIEYLRIKGFKKPLHSLNLNGYIYSKSKNKFADFDFVFRITDDINYSCIAMQYTNNICTNFIEYNEGNIVIYQYDGTTNSIPCTTNEIHKLKFQNGVFYLNDVFICEYVIPDTTNTQYYGIFGDRDSNLAFNGDFFYYIAFESDNTTIELPFKSLWLAKSAGIQGFNVTKNNQTGAYEFKLTTLNPFEITSMDYGVEELTDKIVNRNILVASSPNLKYFSIKPTYTQRTFTASSKDYEGYDGLSSVQVNLDDFLKEFYPMPSDDIQTIHMNINESGEYNLNDITSFTACNFLYNTGVTKTKTFNTEDAYAHNIKIKFRTHTNSYINEEPTYLFTNNSDYYLKLINEGLSTKLEYSYDTDKIFEITLDNDKWYTFESYNEGDKRIVKINDYIQEVEQSTYTASTSTNYVLQNFHGELAEFSIKGTTTDVYLGESSQNTDYVINYKRTETGYSKIYLYNVFVRTYNKGVNGTINVDVSTKINVEQEKIKLAGSKFTELPSYFDFSGIIDMSYMFEDCSNLKTFLIDSSNVNNMNNAFSYCGFEYINKPDTLENQLITTNVIDMRRAFSYSSLKHVYSLDTRNVTNAERTFYSCGKLEYLCALNAEKMNFNGYGIFGGSLPKLTYFGGLIGLKTSMNNNNYGFDCCPNLSYESCINVLNGLYDFTGNGETPNSNQGQLKVHQNFINLVGDEINIATSKNWIITA